MNLSESIKLAATNLELTYFAFVRSLTLAHRRKADNQLDVPKADIAFAWRRSRTHCDDRLFQSNDSAQGAFPKTGMRAGTLLKFVPCGKKCGSFNPFSFG